MSATEEVSWKLARCGGCQQYRMMLADSASCPDCERESRDVNLSAEDLRWIISFRGPESFIRDAWRLANENTSAAMGVDMRTGAITAHRCPAGDEMPVEETEDVLILAVCPAHRRAELPEFLEAGAEGMLSEEDAEKLACEVVVRSSLGDGGERFWRAVDEQLANLGRTRRAG